MDYHFLKRPNTKKIIVFFSGRGGNIGSVFQWFNFSQKIPLTYDILFFRDKKDKFYINGVDGFSNSEIDTADRLSKYSYEEWNFIGSSMGGYGAISCANYMFEKYNILVNLLVFNPFINLNLSHFKTPPHRNLESLFFHKSAKTWCIIGGAEYDNLQCKYLQNNWIKFNYPKCKDHNIALYMKHKKLLIPVFEKFLNIKFLT